MKLTSVWPLACLLLSGALAVHAEPQTASVVYHEELGLNEALNLEFEVRYVQVTGIERNVQRSVNDTLKALAFGEKQAVVQLLTSDPGEPGMPGLNGVYVDASVGVVTDELLSVSILVNTYFAGAEHPNTSSKSMSFDLRNGERISASTLLGPNKAKLLGRLSAALQREYGDYLGEDAFADRPTVADLQDVVIAPEGLTFMWGTSGLGAPYAAGPIMATLPWGQISDVIDRDGMLRTAVALDPDAPQVDLALGGDDLVTEPDAPLTLDDQDDPSANYLIGLEDQLLGGFSTLTIQERLALLRDSSWTEGETGDDFLGSLGEMGLEALASRVHSVRSTLRSHYDPATVEALKHLEFPVLTASLQAALENTASGRVITAGNPLRVRRINHDGEWGTPIARVPHGGTVAVLAPAGSELFHTVMLADGTVGRMHRSYLLVETPAVDTRGRAYRTANGRLVFGTQDGPALIAKDGPGHADAELDALAALMDSSGQTPPVNLIAIDRQIGSSPAWLAVVEFTDLSNVDQLGEGRPVDGLVDKLPE